jgi:DNA-binding response OmpR family regulator
MRDTEPRADSTWVVMVVDDELELVTMLREVLEFEGYRVLSSSDAVRAPLEIQQAQPNLVILDVRMRGAADFQVLRAIKSDATTAAIPVLLCTALHPGSAELQAEVAQHGCALLLKPFELDTLVDQIKHLLGG